MEVCFGCGKECFSLATPMRCADCVKNKILIQTSPVRDSYWVLTKEPCQADEKKMMSGECDSCGEHALECECSPKISDSELEKYVNQAFTEELIQRYENQILAVMKHRQEKYPSEKNDREWLAFTNFVCRRRCQSVTPPSITEINPNPTA